MSSKGSDSVAQDREASQLAERYRTAEEAADGAVADLQRRIGRVEAGRLASFLLGATLALLRDELTVPTALPFSIALGALVVFVWLVVLHRRLRRGLSRAVATRSLARMGIRRIERDWIGLASALAEVGYHDPLFDPPEPGAEAHPYATDLALFGPASVRALLGPTPTPTGLDTLRRWLEEPATVDDVRRRQDAVRALAEDLHGRQELAIESLLVDRVDREGWRAFRDWVERPPLFGGDGASGPALPTWARTFAIVLPLVTIGLFAEWFLFRSWPAWTWVLPLAIQAVFAWRWGLELGPYFDRASGRSPGLRRHHPLLLAWEGYDGGGTVVREIGDRLVDEEGGRASTAIRSLERWLDAADSRASMFHPVLAGGLMWDIHVAWGLERWRARAGGHVGPWFAALGELEALSALATLAHDQPAWSFPSISEGPPSFEADALGHPLLSDAERRTSDVRLPGPGGFLLVTGSNMSGKSTLLRSIGLAAVLGQAGSVVCASRASLSPLRTFTSMTIHDSLTEGVSLFMAELLRLKALVESADSEADGTALLYLIDEVLQGTNSEERRVAARRIVKHLLASNAIGAVTTHDLALHDDPVLDPAAAKVHFREEVGDEGDRILTFDYVLRLGLATSRNALKLLEVVGLGEG